LVGRAEEQAAAGPLPLLASVRGLVTVPHVETFLIGGSLCDLFGEVFGARSPRSRERNVAGQTARHRFVSATSKELGAGPKEPSAINRARMAWTRFLKDYAAYRELYRAATIGD
jgi:hypothetical protein